MSVYLKIAKELGITEVELTRRTRHYFLTGKIGDKTIRQTLSVSASDRRALANVTARLRREVFAATGTKPWLT
jgi:hypothetical protein